MDNRFKQGLLSYEQRFYRNATIRGDCVPAPPGSVLAEVRPACSCRLVRPPPSHLHPPSLIWQVSSTYFDYPKAPARIASVLPGARIVIVLREPVSRALSAFNWRWMTWLCGKLVWTRPDCWAAVTSEVAWRVGSERARAPSRIVARGKLS
jgi:hypothetical protein